jgi:integrase
MFNTSEELKEGLKLLIREILEDDTPSGPVRFPHHRDAIEPWSKAIEQGTFDGKPFSHHTIGFYTKYVNEFIDNYQTVSFENLERALNDMPIEQFSRRRKYFQAIICFGKYLIRDNSLPESFLTKAKKIKPKRHIPPRQTCVTEDQVNALLQACRTPYEVLLIFMLSATGLRAGEFCALKRKDLNLEDGYLTIENGKWGKRRRVGLSYQVIQLLETHLETYQITGPDEHVFLDAKLQPLTRDGLLTRLYKIGKRAGVHVHPHALRRAFVTINANKGRPLQMLQMACGHSSITTTLSYCKTSEDEMLSAMRQWE